MSFVLTGYSSSGCQEFILPTINNANHVVTLDHILLGLVEDVEIHLDVVNNEWRFVGLSDNCILKSDCTHSGDIIFSGYTIQIVLGVIDIALVFTKFEPKLDAMKKYQLPSSGRLTIGTEQDNHIICHGNTLISRYHATLTIEQGTCLVSDNSTNGTFINGRRIQGMECLPYGACVSMFGSQIVWLGDVIAIGSKSGSIECSLNEAVVEQQRDVAKTEISKRPILSQYFRRSPRNMPSLFTDKIEVEAPPQPHAAEKRPLLLTIGPSLTMALPMIIGTGIAIYGTQANGGTTSTYMYTGIIIAVLSAIIGVIWTLANLRYSKKQEKIAEEYRIQKYAEYIETKEKEIVEKYKYNIQSMNFLYPDAAHCSRYSDDTPELWNRNVRHDDFLFIRLGIGTLPFQCAISIPAEKFSLTDDVLSGKPKELQKKYAKVKEIPVGIDLRQKALVGIIGQDEKTRMQIVRDIVIQAAAHICYTDLKMVFLFKGNTVTEQETWAFARWLPHTWSADRRIRFFAADENERGEVCYSVAGILRARADQEGGTKDRLHSPHYLIFVSDPELLEGEAITKYLFNPEQKLGITTILLAERFEQLPNTCVDIIENDPAFRGVMNIEHGTEENLYITFDNVAQYGVETFARKISAIKVRETEGGGEIPDSLSFLDMYHISKIPELNVTDRWIKNRTYESLKVPVGQRAGGSLVYLDIHERHHGPHGLLAGTTGSGKSETLQTYILSLAVNFNPNDVAFFLIDFKGGGMANLFANLPHTAGYISNLSGNQIHRAMVSIKSENRRRQRIFGEYGVNHIDQYTRLYKNNEAQQPVPHLFIVIDEFAELKRDEPEFMRELISVAQVGRSLGVHLILATQKPSGTVDDNIWSNTRFRLCLRVQDRQDSNDVLHKPDAAYLTQAGRCYMQVGNDEIYELFQSGWSGAEYDDDATAGQSEIASIWNNTGCSAITGNSHKARLLEKKRTIWLTALLSCAQKAADQTGVSIDVAESNDTYVAALYTNIASVGYDYPMSSTNSMRALDFVRECMRGYDGDKHTNIQAVVKKFQMLGKKLPEIRERTQLSALVEHLAKVSDATTQGGSYALWLPVLPKELYWFDLCKEPVFNGEHWPNLPTDVTLSVPIGLYDDPANQAQHPLIVDLAGFGNLAVCGSVVSGKSTFLQTLLYALVNKYSPEQLNIYALDYSNHLLAPFEVLSHVGGVVYDSEPDKTEKLFVLLSGVLDERKKMFQGGNYAQFVRARGRAVPYIVVAIDNYASFREKTDNRFESVLVTLAREGSNYGIFFAIAAGGFGGTEIQSRLGDYFRNVICLELSDKFKYSEALGTHHFDVLPESNIKGRGLANVNGTILEFQTALSLNAEDDYDRIRNLEVCFDAMNEAWQGKKARRIPVIPDEPVWNDFLDYDWGNTELFVPGHIPYAWNVKDASLASINLSQIYCWLINGKARTGKSNLLKTLIAATSRENAERIVVEIGNGRLSRFADSHHAKYVSNAKELFETLKGIVPLFKERNIKKQDLLTAGLDEHEIYVAMTEYKPVYLFIDGLADFLQCIYTPPEGVGDMSKLLTNLTEKGRLHNIYFIATMDSTDAAKLSAYKVYTNMSGYRTGIHLGGNVAGQRIFDFSTMPYSEQTKTTKPGVGLIPPDMESATVQEVRIPQIKG